MENAAHEPASTKAGLTPEDLAWLKSINWNDAAVPPADATNIADYRRREAALRQSIAHLGVTERGESLEGKVAAAIGARLADLRDPECDEN